MISGDELAILVGPLTGLRVSHPWRGYGSAIFLELGQLKHPRSTRTGERHPTGEACVMIEWSWRVETARSVAFGSYSLDRKIANGLESLTGRTVEHVEVVGRIPELVLTLSGGRWVHSFTTVEGQPQWALRLRDSRWIKVQRGVLRFDTPA